MYQIKTKVLSGIISKQKIFVLAQFATLISIATIAPIFHQQIITGSIVNATLFISVILFGMRGAILIGLIPSVIALSIGLLPTVLAPMIPFVMLSNALLILVFASLRARNFWLGIICASFIKFIFLFFASSMIVNLFVEKEIIGKVAIMMSWPQLLTALIGGIIAYLVLCAHCRCEKS